MLKGMSGDRTEATAAAADYDDETAESTGESNNAVS